MNQAIVQFDSSRLLHRISPFLHGHFIEHGGGVYDGIYVGPNSPIPNDGGLRHDVVEALKELQAPVLRWPGGGLADPYHWRDGVGPPQQRPLRRNIPSGQAESNAFGTEEFMRLCRVVGAEPYIALTCGGSVQEAVDWVEYCNGAQPSALRQLREANGSPAPHNVRFWEIGNAPSGCGGDMTPESYADYFSQYAASLREADPSIRLALCGGCGDPDWNHRVLARLGGQLRLADYLSVRCHSGLGLSDRDGSPAKLLQLWRDLQGMETFLRQAIGLLAAQDNAGKQLGLILDQWGTWYEQARPENGNTQANTLADALFAAASLHLFHSLGDRFFMANLAQAVNVLQCLLKTDGPRMAKTPTYCAFQLLRPHQGAQRIAAKIDGPTLDLGGCEIPRLSASVSRPDSGRLFISLINRSPTEPLTVRVIDGQGEAVPLAAPLILRSQSLAGENLADRPRQVSPRPFEGAQRQSPIRIPAASIVAGFTEL